MLVDGEESGARIDPRSGIVILDAVAHHGERGVGVPTEHASALPGAGIMDRSVGDLV